MRQFDNVSLPDILELNAMLPHLRPEEFELDAPYAIFWDDQFGRKKVLAIPKGYITDLSSIPRGVRSIIPVIGRQNGPAVIHDYVYEPGNDRPEGEHQLRGWTKEEADTLFLLAMKSVGVGWWRRNTMYASVKYGGGNAWRTKNK